MNYLAHAYLSFDHPQVLAGNLISDFVKGKKKSGFLPGIQKGIELHRSIDQYTDSHPATKEAKQVFRNTYRLYSGAFVDVVYDHFLANDENEFSESSLLEFTGRIYLVMESYLDQVPPPFARMFYYMQKENWLFHYRSVWGIEKSFGGLVRKAAYLTESDTACKIFETHYQLLSDCYRQFWKEMKPFAFDTFHSLLNPGPGNLS